MEHPLPKQRKARSAIPHTLAQLQFVDFSLDQSIVLDQRESYCYRCFVSLYPGHKAPKFGDMVSHCLREPGIDLLSHARTSHLRKLLHEIVSPLYFL